jgi:hypothetical protein
MIISCIDALVGQVWWIELDAGGNSSFGNETTQL